MKAFATLLVLMFLPATGWTCAVCVGGNEPNRMAFIFTTILLTIVPLVVVGCAVRWIQKRAEERDALLESSPTEAR